MTKTNSQYPARRFIYRDELSGRPRGIIVAILYNLTKRDEALITSSLIGVLFV